MENKNKHKAEEKVFFKEKKWELKLFDSEINSPYIINKYKHLKKNEFKREKIYFFLAKIIFPLLMITLLILSIVGLSLNISGKSADLVKFNTSSNVQNNIISVIPNINIEMKDGYDNGYIKYNSVSKRYEFSYFYEENPFWSEMINDFNYLHSKTEEYCKKNNLIYHETSTFRQSNVPLQILLQKGINFEGVFAITNNPENFNDFYVAPQTGSLEDSALIQIPVFSFLVNSYFSSYDENSRVIQNLKNFLISEVNNYSSSSTYFKDWQIYTGPYDEDKASTTTGINLQVSVNTNNIVLTYFKGIIFAFLFIFIVLLLYLLIRFKWYNLVSFFSGGIFLTLLTFGLLTLIFPINLAIFTLFLLMIFIIIFNLSYFILKSSGLVEEFSNLSKFKFVKKNDIKVIAYKTILGMKKILFLEIGIFIIFGFVWTLLFGIPTILTTLHIVNPNKDSNLVSGIHIAWRTLFQNSDFTTWWHYSLLLLIVVPIIIFAFVTTFVWMWIHITYWFINRSKVYTINSLMYKPKNFENKIKNINDTKYDYLSLEDVVNINPELKNDIFKKSQNKDSDNNSKNI